MMVIKVNMFWYDNRYKNTECLSQQISSRAGKLLKMNDKMNIHCSSDVNIYIVIYSHIQIITLTSHCTAL